jgi:hypothetical protein
VQIRMIEQDQIMRLRLEGDHANGPSIRDMLRKELMAADREGRNPWLRTMQYSDYPNNRDRIVFGVDPAAPGGDTHIANIGVSGMTAREVIADDWHVQTAQLDPRQHEQMQRWMNDMVEDQLMGRTDRPRRYAQSNNR